MDRTDCRFRYEVCSFSYGQSVKLLAIGMDRTD